MKVIVNATGYVGQSNGAGGAGVFLQYLVSRLSEACDVDVLVAPGAKSFSGAQRRARIIELPYLTGETLQQLRSGPTTVIDPFGGLPCEAFPDDMGLCIVIHDLMHLERGQYFTDSEREGRSRGFAMGLRRADAVVVFTEDQARAVRRFYPGARPTVIPHLPYMTLGGEAPPEADLPAGLERFVLFPGVKWPHKNHRTLIEAFGAYARRSGSDLKLVLCGGPCAENRFSFYPTTAEIDERVVDLGRVPDAAAHALFAHAEAVLFPTLYEGFGIPVLEAAHMGKMVVASALPVFDEILGATGYRRVEDPLCQLRWMEALADVEGPARAGFEIESATLRRRIDEAAFLESFTGVLAESAERYASPALYPVRAFPEGDRLTSRVAAQLAFSDIFGSAAFERGPRQAALGARPSPQPSTIFRSAGGAPDRRSCIRSQYEASAPDDGRQGPLEFTAWVRLLDSGGLERLNWSVNDGQVIDLAPRLKDGEWRLVRAPVPPKGYIDFRGLRGGSTEVAGFDLEIHDPLIVRVPELPTPVADRPPQTLTIVVEAMSGDRRAPAEGGVLAGVARRAHAVNAALGAGAASLRWLVLADPDALGEASGADLPSNLQVRFALAASFGRPDAAGLLTPYDPVSRLVLLEAEDLAALETPANLEVLAGTLRFTPLLRESELQIDRQANGFWLPAERGRVIVGLDARTGAPVPLLEPAVIAASLEAELAQERPRFAVIETDRTSKLSHHSAVTTLFLEGARELGFQPVLGLNRQADDGPAKDVETWSGFSSYVYAVGSADQFADELAEFVKAMGLGRDDVIFMHSLSPQILLGAARFVAADPEGSPRFAMRFFSSAEAMAGHKLSYVKILRSIEAVGAVRRRMQFFCESRNLVRYYEQQVGVAYPLLFNPQHPALTMVRDSAWFDPGLGGGEIPTLAYFGEAREEKGFDDVPGIIAALIESPEMEGFRFLVQTGSNQINDTPRIARAKETLAALRRKHPDRIRTFEQVETPEQFYFLMKHVNGVLAPYKPAFYGKRGTGVTLEALQMGLEVFAWASTDLCATFAETGRVIAVAESDSFAAAVARHFARGERAPRAEMSPPIGLPPISVCERLLTFCMQEAPRPSAEPVLWVGNDTFGEGCSAVFSAQKRALQALGRDCLELYVPWPDRNWAGVEPNAYDARLYGFDSLYESRGLAWVALPTWSAGMMATLDEIERVGASFRTLRRLSEHYGAPATLRRAIASSGLRETVLNYAHLHPVIAELAPGDGIVCETHDVIAYQTAVRRGDGISLAEKIDEFSELARFRRIISISADEQREMAGACAGSTVYWRLPPFLPEEPARPSPQDGGMADVRVLQALGGVPDDVALPSASMLRAWRARADVQAIFPLDNSDGRLALFRWWFLWGQFETTGGFDLTDRQFEWLTGRSTEEGAQLDGMSRLTLSIRDDLVRAFWRGGAFDAAGLRRWEETDARRDLGFSRQDLLQRGKRVFGGPQRERRSDEVLKAVLDADPFELAELNADVGLVFDRIADAEAIDLALVGSGHPANIESFSWFLNEVFMPHFAPRGRKLFMVGSACRSFVGASHPGVILLGRCTRIEPIVRAARACPLPVVAGSGSPIKTIPAMALNGAVTPTEHVGRAFGLGDWGIPSFADPREFADDLWTLLRDDGARARRQASAARYVEENLSLRSYVDFWRSLIPAAPGPAEAPERVQPTAPAAERPPATRAARRHARPARAVNA